MRKALLLMLAVVTMVAGLGFSSVAMAETTDAQADTTVDVCRGTLTAQGDGIAVLGGRGVVDASGNGILWVKDRAGDATIEVTGYGQMKVYEDGWVQYAGFHGTAHIEGSRIIVVLAGVDADLTAEGRGRVRLWGHGTFQIGDRSGEWNTGRGTHLKFASLVNPVNAEIQ
ncbi:MAG: hypothetical protein SVO26_00735 [Chloroflexota bacterium]|nr:hypothetical protein [Chloroflexota bacterium]